ncbi:D-amino acid dehydrogenase small subunit [Roseovarius litorisediminis]|uniref:D-amino acid dehydrogenase small subunit n=1 Tax=Roseovarius litorisediminis TaxID=1312363 RepID=A0A1Y5R8L4_9RHOB|nr:FAD-binding oxidoreductase [Roseovarius litorisediminis]SLN10588.1 D-amino acid dehydrogenase small subunit [Roseovarius litorisediminis]
MSSETNNPVAVIGGGIVGICTALTLAERGVRVQLFDRDTPGQGASMGNAGVVSPFAVVPQSLPGTWRRIPRWLLDPLGPVALHPTYLPRFLPWALRFLKAGRQAEVERIATAMHMLNHDNVDLYRQHLKGTGHEDLIRESCYVMASRDPAKLDLSGFEMDLRRQYGPPPERIDRTELRRIEPALSADFSGAILIRGQARATDPGRICAVLLDKLKLLGGIVTQAEVVELKPDDGGSWQIITSSGTHAAEQVVLSAGAWSARLLAPLGVKVPLEAERGYHIVFPDAGVTLNNSVMDMDKKFVASSMDMGLRAAGTAEFGGLGSGPSDRRAGALATVARQMCPDLGKADYNTWSGFRPSFPDSLPAIGAIPGQPGLTAAFGHSHWGFMMGPKTGRLAADLVMARNTNIDLSSYRPDRFS